MATEQALQERLKHLVDHYGPSKEDLPHCRGCGDFTSGWICPYCFPEEAIEESNICAALRKGA